MRRFVCVVVALVGLAGCGVPTKGEPTTIPAAEIPYGLAAPEPTDPADSTLQTDVAATAVYLVAPDDVLVPRGRDLPPAPLVDRLEALLRELASGPSAPERADKLSTTLPPEVLLDVSQVEGGTATIDIAGPVEAPSGSDSRVAVAQIVLTATSIPQVHAVRLMREGELIDAPLPDGELTSAPLTADDYASYLTPPPPPTPTPSSPR
jgi:spore germination protein GerM